MPKRELKGKISLKSTENGRKTVICFKNCLKKRKVHFTKQLEERGSRKSSPKAMNRQGKEQNWLQNALSRARKSKVAFKSTENDKFHFRKGGEEMKTQKFSQNELRREGKGQNLLKKAWETVGKEKNVIGQFCCLLPYCHTLFRLSRSFPSLGQIDFLPRPTKTFQLVTA